MNTGSNAIWAGKLSDDFQKEFEVSPARQIVRPKTELQPTLAAEEPLTAEPAGIDFSKVTVEALKDEEIYEKIFAQHDEFAVSKACDDLIERARKLGCGTAVKKIIKSRRRAYEQRIKQRYISEQMANIDGRAVKAGFIANGEHIAYITPTNLGEYKVNPALLAEFIRKHCHYKVICNELAQENRIYWYDSGVYRAINDEELLGKIRPFIEKLMPEILRVPDLRDTGKLLKCVADPDSDEIFDTNEELINFKNGVLNIETGEFREHDPSFLSTVQLDFNYEPEANECTTTKEYIKRLFRYDEECINFAYEYVGVILSNVHAERAKTALFITGEPHSGKSRIIELVEKMLGKRNYCITSPQDLEENRFSSSALCGKRLAAYSDLGLVSARGTEILKQLTGGDSIRGEIKNGPAFQFTYHGSLWFACNELPKFRNADKAFYDRLVILQAAGAVPQSQRDPLLVNKMFAEASAAFNTLFLPALKDFIKNGYRYDVPASNERSVSEYNAENSSSVQFFNECCANRRTLDVVHGDRSTQGAVNQAYKRWCIENGYHQASARTFRSEIANYLKCSSPTEMEIRKNYGRYYIFELTSDALLEYVDKQ